MKKQNILDLLCDDLISMIYTKEENFKKCITDFNKCITDNIIPYLEDCQTIFGFVFDLNSNDKTVKEKSQFILSIITREFKELVSVNPDYFLIDKEEKGFDMACKFLLQNILAANDIKTLLNL